MNSDLILMSFIKEQDALKAKGALEIMRNSPFLGAMNAIPLSKDRDGQVVIQIQQPPQDQIGLDSWLSFQFANILFGESEDKLQELVDAGLDEEFVQETKTAPDPECSLILIYVRDKSLVDTQQLLDTIKQFNGNLYLTTITPQVEEVILKPGQNQMKI